ncbi:glycine cleavage system protein GcvH [Granulicella sp. 5B5]|uniref:glycine cleavage system protein GcvH n=1 Tax=Granulicella sp. 5B5 TaxID=1617967 RepID=UPI0015F50EC3|nr:glycine cleavage system protein GcvH [Granulicella sp. 5B5]QMV19498.1 glycine cleavage system protein GcvH [Granulicella sp. 5B5]
MSYPEKYRYAKSHEWVDLQGDTAVVGITDYAQSSLGDIVFVELPKVGQDIEVGSTFGSVESVKAVSDLYSPVTGQVSAINEALNDAPDTINTAANDTWIIKVAVKSADEVGGMMTAAEYEAFVKEETGH